MLIHENLVEEDHTYILNCTFEMCQWTLGEGDGPSWLTLL